jgi:hypothetical protein
MRNSWEIRSDQRRATVTEHLAIVAVRIEPFKGAIRAFLDGSAGATAEFTVVRDLDDEDGEEEELPFDPTYGQKLAGQHQLLGWDLSLNLMELMLYLEAPLEIAEYG